MTDVKVNSEAANGHDDNRSATEGRCAMNFLTLAKNLLARGFSVIPLKPRDKASLTAPGTLK